MIKSAIKVADFLLDIVCLKGFISHINEIQ